MFGFGDVPSHTLISGLSKPQFSHLLFTSHFSKAGWTRVTKAPQLGQTKYLFPHLVHILSVPFSTNRKVRFIHSSVTIRKTVPPQLVHFFGGDGFFSDMFVHVDCKLIIKRKLIVYYFRFYLKKYSDF